jgi:hypothetical protein
MPAHVNKKIEIKRTNDFLQIFCEIGVYILCYIYKASLVNSFKNLKLSLTKFILYITSSSS